MTDRHFSKSGRSRRDVYQRKLQFEHWYRDRTVYFLTARVREQKHMFDTPETSSIFWQKFDQYTREAAFEPWVATLISNHYHTVGFLPQGLALKEMMRKLHGSVATLVCKSLKIQHKPFWRDDDHNDYTDGCLRDETQLRRSYVYVRDQAVKAGIVASHDAYPNTRVYRSLDDVVAFAHAEKAFMEGVPYKRYDRR